MLQHSGCNFCMEAYYGRKSTFVVNKIVEFSGEIYMFVYSDDSVTVINTF